MALFKTAGSQEAKENKQFPPKHVAIIMDGNGRWAKRQHQARVFGHKAGMENVKKIALAANKLGVKVLTLFAFSTENWGRPKSEVNYLMRLPIDFFNVFVPELMENNIRVEVIGEVGGLPLKTRQAVEKAVTETRENTGMILNFAFNYGGRREIVDAAQSIARQVQSGLIQPEQIDDQLIQDNLLTRQLGEMANPDLIIRTSGEKRISNFLLWQAAYSEFVFSDKLWPDFSDLDLQLALTSFQKRDRRFGKIKES